MKKSAVLFTVIFISLMAGCASKNSSFGDMSPQALYLEYFNLAETYMEMKKYDKALQLYEKAKVLEDTDKACSYKIARIYIEQSKWPEACEIFQELLKTDADNSSLKESLAYCHAMNGNKKEALKLYREVLSTGKETEDVLTNVLSVLCSFQKDEKISESEKSQYHSEASTFIERMKELYPENKNIPVFNDILNPAVDDSADAESDAESEVEAETFEN